MEDFTLPIRDFSFLDDENLSIEEKHKQFNATKRLVLQDMVIFGESKIQGLSEDRVRFWFPEVFKDDLFTVKLQ